MCVHCDYFCYTCSRSTWCNDKLTQQQRHFELRVGQIMNLCKHSIDSMNLPGSLEHNICLRVPSNIGVIGRWGLAVPLTAFLWRPFKNNILGLWSISGIWTFQNPNESAHAGHNFTMPAATQTAMRCFRKSGMWWFHGEDKNNLVRPLKSKLPVPLLNN